MGFFFINTIAGKITECYLSSPKLYKDKINGVIIMSRSAEGFKLFNEQYGGSFIQIMQ